MAKKSKIARNQQRQVVVDKQAAHFALLASRADGLEALQQSLGGERRDRQLQTVASGYGHERNTRISRNLRGEFQLNGGAACRQRNLERHLQPILSSWGNRKVYF